MHIVADGRELGRRKHWMDRRPKVMAVLYDAEDAYPGLGLSLKDLFFPVGQQKEEEIAKWKEYAISLRKRKKEKKNEYRTKLHEVQTKLLEVPTEAG